MGYEQRQATQAQQEWPQLRLLDQQG